MNFLEFTLVEGLELTAVGHYQAIISVEMSMNQSLHFVASWACFGVQFDSRVEPVGKRKKSVVGKRESYEKLTVG